MAAREGNIRKELWLNSWGKILDIEVCQSGMSSPGRQWESWENLKSNLEKAMPCHSEGSCASGGWIQLFNSLIFVCQDVLSVASSLGVSLRFLRKNESKGWILERVDGCQSLCVKGIHHVLPAGCESC